MRPRVGEPLRLPTARFSRAWDSLRRGARFVQRQGLLAALRRIRADRLPFSAVPDFAYRDWLRNEPHPDFASVPASLDCVSLLVPLHESKREHIVDLYESLRAQTHANWQLCFSVDGTLDRDVLDLLVVLRSRDERVVVLEPAGASGISAATNAALGVSYGDLVGLLDHDDLLPPHALELAARAFSEDARLDLVYTDEDMLSPQGERRSPLLKPGPSPILLLGTNYVMHLVVMRRDFMRKLGGLRPMFDGAQDHDLLLRGFEQARRVRHLAWIGYHWRTGDTSVASGSSSKPWAYERGRAAVAEACVRRGIACEAVSSSAIPGLYEIELTRLARRIPLHVAMHGTGPDCEAWSRLLALPSDEIDVRSVAVGTWPTRVPAGEHLLVIDARVSPNASALAQLARWASVPGVGAVGSTGRGRWLPASTGFGLTASGRARALPALTLHARLPHEVASPGASLLLLSNPDAARTAALSGRRLTRVDAICMGAAAWTEDKCALFLPLPDLRPRMELPIDRAQLDLGASALWPEIARALPHGFWSNGVDCFGRRHPLLTTLGAPPHPHRKA